MPSVSEEYGRYRLAVLKGMDLEYTYVRSHLKELAQFIIPQRYLSLDEGKRTSDKERNRYILDGHATMSARTLSSGMLYGATNPAHRWLKLGMTDNRVAARRWIDGVADMTLQAMGRSNLYNALATTYLDLGVFGTSAMLIYEDRETMFRAYNLPAGEYRVAKDARGKVSTLGRKLRMTVNQIVERFGIENVEVETARVYTNPTGNKFTERDVYHLIEPNRGLVPEEFAFQECYWEKGSGPDRALSIAGYYEKPFIAPRWEVVGNNTYGVSPGMDALPDIISLQHLTRKRAQGMDKQVSPPIVADQALRNQPSALMPNGITYAPSASTIGAKPLYTVNMPYNELREDKISFYDAIDRFFFTDLFRAILDIRTVRSATEIAEKAAEKLVLLGPVVGRVEDEALSDMITRVMAIMQRAGIYPPAPPLTDAQLTIDYDSILSSAQKAAGINNIERFLSVTGQILPVAPGSANVVNWNEMLREYGDRLNIPARVLRTRDEVAQLDAQQAQAEQEARDAQIAKDLGAATQSLSAADVTR